MTKSKTPAYDAVKTEMKRAEAKKPRIEMIPAFIKVRGKDEWISNPKANGQGTKLTV
jgi:hypothetical protein